MTVLIAVGKKEHLVDPEGTIASALCSIDLMPDTFLFFIDEKPVPMDTILEDGMNIKAIKVASGG
jgi:Sulfur transfer protein involved in thiamine biosynthesis